MPLLYARTLLPLTFLPPAGHWRDTTRKARFVLDPRPLPDPEDAAALVLTRYLEAFGPAASKDVAAWAGVAQRDFPWHARPDGHLPRRAGPRAARPAGPPAPAGRHRAPAALPRPLGPAAAGLRRPRPHHPARGPAAEAHPERRLHRDRRRPRRRELAHGRARSSLIKPHTDFDHAAVRDEALRTARFCAPETRSPRSRSSDDQYCTRALSHRNAHELARLAAELEEPVEEPAGGRVGLATGRRRR